MTRSVFYNLASEEGEHALARLRELGHRVGHHAVWPERRPGRRASTPSSPGTTRTRSSWPGRSTGAVNVMSEPWFSRDHYRSDSNQHWRAGCPHEELAARRVRVAAAAHPSRDLGLPGRDDARDDARRCSTPSASATSNGSPRTGSTSREATSPSSSPPRARRARPRCCARCARTASGEVRARRHRHGGARGRAAPVRRVPRRAGRRPTRGSPTRCAEVAEREGVDAVLPQSSFDLHGLAAAPRPLRRHRGARLLARRDPPLERQGGDVRAARRDRRAGAGRGGASSARAAVEAAAHELGYPERGRRA